MRCGFAAEADFAKPSSVASHRPVHVACVMDLDSEINVDESHEHCSLHRHVPTHYTSASKTLLMFSILVSKAEWFEFCTREPLMTSIRAC
jgi:hypothetical protein